MKYLLFVLLLTGCGPEPTMFQGRTGDASNSPMVVEDDRFKVERAAVFEDELAFNSKRAIYIVTDKKSERQYLGVSGIGITEIGSHNCGKNCTAQDER